MGYTIYWKPKRHFSEEELRNLNAVFMRTYKTELAKLKARGLNTQTYEWGETLITNEEFNFLKTARIPYDYAVKRALIDVQGASNNGYNITCDDGFSYDSDGVHVDGSAYSDNYKSRVPIHETLQLSDLPISFETVKAGLMVTGEYDWNKGKKPLRLDAKSSAPKKERKQPLRADERICARNTATGVLLQIKRGCQRR